MIKTLQKIDAVRDYESQGKRNWNKAFVVLDEDIDYSKLPEISETETVRTMNALSFKDGKGFIEFNFAKNTLGATSEGSAGDITSTANHNLAGTLAGESVAIDNLLQQVGVPCHIVVVDRFTKEKTIYGRPYSPMTFSSFSKRKNGDNTSADVTFTQESLLQPLKYLGEIAEAPAAAAQE